MNDLTKTACARLKWVDPVLAHTRSRRFAPESAPRPYFWPPASAGLCHVDEGRGAVGPSEADGLVDAANHPNNKQPANRMGAGCLDDADGRTLVQAVDGETAAELGLEPGGLGGHDIAGVGNADELVHGHGVEGKGHLHLSGIHAAGEFSQAADSAHEIDAV